MVRPVKTVCAFATGRKCEWIVTLSQDPSGAGESIIEARIAYRGKHALDSLRKGWMLIDYACFVCKDENPIRILRTAPRWGHKVTRL
jgi:hypothetical protein